MRLFICNIKKGSMGTKEDFYKLSVKELYRKFFVEEYFDAGLARGYGISKKEVRNRRKEKGLTWLSCGLKWVGGDR